MHQFADDTNLLNFKSCVKSITKQVNYDLKNFVIWFKANKIPLNVGKLNLCFLLNQINNLTEIWNKRLNGKMLYETDLVKYLGIQIDKSTTGIKRLTLQLLS